MYILSYTEKTEIWHAATISYILELEFQFWYMTYRMGPSLMCVPLTQVPITQFPLTQFQCFDT